MALNYRAERKAPSLAGQYGFSLIELMVVVAIIAIIASIALPSYNEHVRKSRRAAGTACLVQAAQQMERFYTTSLDYSAAGSPDAFNCDGDTEEFYTVAPDEVDTKEYVLTATPTGRQEGDSCGTLSIDQAGNRQPETPGCW